MKPKKIARKLSLKKETISNLNNGQMNGVRGGLPPSVTCTEVCSKVTWCTCFGTCDTSPIVCTNPNYCYNTGNYCPTDGCTDTACTGGCGTIEP